MMENSENSDPLESLLAAFDNDAIPKTNKLKETNLFEHETNQPKPTATSTKNSLIHSGDTDSSDDEDSRNWEDSKYSQHGRDIKKLLEQNNTSNTNNVETKRVSNWKKPISTNPIPKVIKPPETQVKHDVFTDPIFGLRIIKPLISSATLKERMIGRDSVNFYGLSKYIQTKSRDKDWVIAGVIVNKTVPKVSQKGNKFSMWTLSDLKDDIKTICMYLFSGANEQLWKTSVGTVVGILNPDVLENKSKYDVASLSVNNAQKVMIFGQSKDFGTCKSTKKNGEKCTAIVNKSKCEYCIYHIKQEYQKCSIRSDIQSSFGGRGLTALRNKVLGKNEVFYAGKSYTAVPAKKSKKLEAKDNMRLTSLLERNPVLETKIKTAKKKAAPRLEVSAAQRLRDIQLLEKLREPSDLPAKTKFDGVQSAEVTVEDAKNLATSVLNKLKAKQQSNNPSNTQTEPTKLTHLTDHVPKLSGFDTGVVDLSKPIARRTDRAKEKAIRLVQKSGPIKKVDPNSTRGSGVKRPIAEPELHPEPKKPKTDSTSFQSERFKKIMAAASNHQDLVESRDEEEKEKYFKKLEMKENMEEKMINTHKVACKAVKCLQCKYVSFSASDRCKTERHNLKVFDAVKRFYKCGHCQNRTVCLEIVPLKACSNCGTAEWIKTGMMKEKLITSSHNLSIRGGEQKNVNSDIIGANLDLLVCKRFNEVGKTMLSRGFVQLEKRHAKLYKQVKLFLPRRESERKSHHLARHFDILQAVETRISMLNMTYVKFMESNLLCFIPGKVLDEIKNVLNLVQSADSPPRTHQVLQELRDLSSMAMEHFDEQILPKVKERVDKRSAFSYGSVASGTNSSRLVISHQSLSNEIHKVKKQSKTQKHHISFLTQTTQKLFQKHRKQNMRVKAQAAKIREQDKKIREQDRKIQEQSAKIQDQEATLADIKRHLDEWDQKYKERSSAEHFADFKKHIEEWDEKYKDFTAEFERARDELLASVSYKPTARPRQVVEAEPERKRKSNVAVEVPVKRSKAVEAVGDGENAADVRKGGGGSDHGEAGTVEKELKSLIETVLNQPVGCAKNRKRKMAEDIDLK
ncbi:unnamed protein product [Phyllotreta striolata]|uniref:Protein MCM10 homolog n=1 Tax=Phyllotreta striolata TaxID=444603 RepID=A0A9N9XVD8_PHYSR|nr:unnamed protein product [Phyllotreta striolata]